jgi:hypothetical protein
MGSGFGAALEAIGGLLLGGMGLLVLIAGLVVRYRTRSRKDVAP